MKKALKKIPQFKNEDDERDFWDTVDSSNYFDMSQAVSLQFPNLKPTSKPITLRMPQSLINSIKIEANKRDVPYQSLIKVWLADKVKEESQKYKTK